MSPHQLEALEARRMLAVLPANFTETKITRVVTSVAATMAFAPDGRLFVGDTTNGQIRIVKNGALLPTEALTLPAGVDHSRERGINGIAIAPDFATADADKKYVYIYYTRPDAANPNVSPSNAKNRLSRFAMSTSNPDTINAGSELVLLDNIASDSGIHNGGMLKFGADGMLYLGIGENAVGSNSQSLANLNGKILRLDVSNPADVIPDDNPFVNTAGARGEIWAYGLRNPFTGDIKPGTNTLFVNDVGGGQWEEVNNVVKGANYGWPTAEGNSSNPSFTNPIHSYPHNNASAAITGGAFYNGSHFPASYSGDYFFADYLVKKIWVLDPANNNAVTTFATNTISIVDLDVSPIDGSLWYLEIGGNIWKINYSPSPPPPPPPPPGTQSPFKGSPFAVGANLVTIQAEDFDNGGEGVAYHDVQSSNLGGAYRSGVGVDIQPTNDAGGGFNVGYAKPGEWLEYTINVASAGNYDFGFRVASGASNGKFHFEIDGANKGQLTIPNTSGWQDWTTVTKTSVPLSTGQHVLRLFMDAPGTTGSIGNFNYVTVTPSGTPPPPGAQTPFKGSPFAISTGTATIQAEDFDNGGQGVAYNDADSANLGGAYRSNVAVDIQPTSDSGGGFNVGWAKAGEWLEYTINVATAGNYDFGFRVASRGSNGKFHFEIDGSNKGQLTIPNTGNFQNWTTVSKTNVALPAGQHILRIFMDAAGSTGSVGNFNYLTIKPAGATTAVTLRPTQDAHIHEAFSGTNFGDATALLVKKNTTGFNREAYLKFDLSSAAAINSAKLRLFGGFAYEPGVNVRLGVYSVSPNSWSEGTLTYANKPGSSASPLATMTLNSSSRSYREWDLTSFIEAEKAAGRNLVSVVVRALDFSNPIGSFNSDEAASNQPQLVIS